MGGYGSGRRWSSKNTTSGYLRLDVRRLQQRGCLVPGKSSRWYWTLNDRPHGDIQIRSQFDRIVLSYRLRSRSEDWQRKEYSVLLTQTPCHFGGVRQWFLCPARGCGRRGCRSLWRRDIRLPDLPSTRLREPTRTTSQSCS